MEMPAGPQIFLHNFLVDHSHCDCTAEGHHTLQEANRRNVYGSYARKLGTIVRSWIALNSISCW